jgi:hypothetical protein
VRPPKQRKWRETRGEKRANSTEIQRPITVEAVECELKLGRVGVGEGDREAVERGVRRAEDGEDGLEVDAALERRGRRRPGRDGGEGEVVEEVAREGDRRIRRPRAVERVQLQLREEN